MNEQSLPLITGILSKLTAQRLPSWDELPDLDLYMDQVLALVRRYLDGNAVFDAKGLTASMVNNYVKQGVMPAPVKKKYARVHLAHLIVICILKPSLPIASIHRLIAAELEAASAEDFYNSFCRMFADTSSAVALIARESLSPEDSVLVPVYRAALRAQAEKALAIKLLASVLPTEKSESEK